MTRSATVGERFPNLALLLGSFGVLVAMMTVLNSHVTGKIEVAVRFFPSALGLAAVPMLLILAFRNWRANQSARLSTLRNGIGLSSIVALFAVWLVYWAMALMVSIIPHMPVSLGGLDFPVFILILYSILFGFVLAFALCGRSRPESISAAFLMWACIQASIYFRGFSLGHTTGLN